MPNTIEKFATDFKDEIPSDGKRLYKILDTETAEILHNNVEIIRANTNVQEGSPINAKLINSIAECLNILIDCGVFYLSEDDESVTIGNINEAFESKPVFENTDNQEV